MFTRYEPRHDKTSKVSVRPAKTQISLGIRPVWSESSQPAWRNLEPLATHWAHSEDSDQTGRMPRLIWVYPGCTVILLVLSCRGSYLFISTWRDRNISEYIFHELQPCWNGFHYEIYWATPRHNKTYAISEQKRCRSACTSEQSDQRICYSLSR